MEMLLEPYEYLLENPGKDFRKQLIAAFDSWIHVNPNQIGTINEIIGMLHSASLLVDDVEDNSDLRRGAPVAHKIFGVASTINSANYVYFIALQKTLELKVPEAVTMFTEELLQLHRGQGYEIHWRDTVKCPTQDEYLEMVSNKTGGLLRLAVKLMTCCGENKDSNFLELVDILGMHFQIRDDYVNIMSAKYQDTKGFAEDLTEGKFSFPIVHCIHNDPKKRDQLLNILRQRSNDLDVKKYAVKILKGMLPTYSQLDSGSLEYTRLYLCELEARAREAIRKLGGNEILEQILTTLAKEYL